MEKNQRNRGRWAILRRAFQEAAAGAAAEPAAAAPGDGEYSIHRHEGFSALLAKHAAPWRPRTALLAPAEASAALAAGGPDVLSTDAWDPSGEVEGAREVWRGDGFAVYRVGEPEQQADAERVDYVLPGGAGVVSSRQRRARRTLEDLFSHRVHGVDNTGNVRVWASEEVLAFVAVQAPWRERLAGKRVLELGAGMAGVAGLAVAAACAPAAVVLTDGNPASVEGLEAGLSGFPQPAGVSVSAARLLWSVDAPPAEPRFDVVLAADTLFFEDFRDALIATLVASLAPDGVALLLQPRRGGSMQRFVEACAAPGSPLVVTVDEEVHPAVAEMHARFAGDAEYDEDLHRPVLVTARLRSGGDGAGGAGGAAGGAAGGGPAGDGPAGDGPAGDGPAAAGEAEQ